MFTRKPTPSRRSFRPSAEGLETRRVLSSYSTIPTASVSGTDIDGDKWTLTLYGPGTMNIVDKTGAAFTRATADTPNLINTITVAGTVTSRSRLIGTVSPAAGSASDGKVYFQNLNVQNNGAFPQIDRNKANRISPTAQNGIALIDAPDFWMGNTSGAAPTGSSPYHSGFKLAGAITAPEGINVLKFGGIDVNYTAPGGTPLNQTKQNNEFVVSLGLPVITGTSIIVDAVTTNAGVTPGSGNNPSTINQQSASFLVTGRLNLFQAHQINGNTQPGMEPTQFNPAADSPVAGGTYVVSQTGSVTSQIGYVRVAGDATNFTTMALGGDLFNAPPDATGPAVTNFTVGGETNNVMLLAPGGSRNVSFGRGMDNVVISTEFIQHLHANRGAVGSTVTSSRTIDQMILGGDLINSFIQSGYLQTINANAASPGSVFSAGGGAFNGVAPPSIIDRNPSPAAGAQIPAAHGGGGINAHIAGNVVDSIISVSVDPDPSGINAPGEFETVTSRRFPFGAPQNVVLPRGIINAKVEGEIDNAGLQSGAAPLVSPDVAPDSAFFAKQVRLTRGAVVPPNVGTAPFDGPPAYSKAQNALKGSFKARGLRRQ